MENPHPMDRLLCGDVGYGKTEVAMRAAFKAVMDNKQAAILAPTTILAEQHYQNFRGRLSNFPVNIQMLSRFKSKAQQKAIVEDLKNGKIDIIIGTHRLLSNDIAFSDLGLLIIDEEQRFGVMAKERLKVLESQSGYTYPYRDPDTPDPVYGDNGLKRYLHNQHPSSKPYPNLNLCGRI